MTEAPKVAPAGAARIKVWPKPGIDVLDEYSGQPIDPGAEVPYTRLTIRRINDGDLLDKDPGDAANPKKTHAERFGGKADE